MMNSTRRHLAGLLFAAALLPAAVHAAQPAAPATGAAMLSLFGIDLASAPIAAFQAAARDAGARTLGRKDAAERFDVDALSIPAVKGMTVTYARDRVLAAQYELGYQHEQLRKMLESKYGKPSGGRSAVFTGQHLSDGSYVWQFANGMQLVFKKPFFSREPATLTYLNADLFAVIEAGAKDRADREAADKAKAKSDVF
jgi:hypothetical protein